MTGAAPDGVTWSTSARHPAHRGGGEGPGKAKEAIEAARALLPLCPGGGGRADQGRALPAPDALREGDADARAPPRRTAGCRRRGQSAPRRARRSGRRPASVIGVFGGSGFYRFLDDVEEVRGGHAVRAAVGARSAWGRSRASAWPSCRATATSTRFRRTGSTTAPTSGRCARSGSGASSARAPAARSSRSCSPGTFVVCDQFVDRTQRRARTPSTTGPDHPRLGRRPLLPRPAARCSSQRRDGARNPGRATAARWW